MGLGRVDPRRRRRDLLHDRAGAQAVAPRQRRVVAARPGVTRACGPTCSRARRGGGARSATSPTASTCTPGSRRRCARSTTGTSVPTGRQRCSDRALWEAIENVDDGELWETHQALKRQLIEFVRRRAADTLTAAASRQRPCHRTPGAQLRRADDRIRAALCHLQAREAGSSGISTRSRRWSTTRSGRSSSSSPARRIRTTARARRSSRRSRGSTRDPRFAGKMVFVEDYDINVGRHLVQGVDRLAQQPAAAARGVRDERPEGRAQRRAEPVDPRWLVGGSLRRAQRVCHRHGRDALVGGGSRPRDARALLDTLRNEVVPLFYDRDGDGLPREWIARMKRAIRTLGWRFSADRMVMDYVRECYIPAAGGRSCDVKS